MFLIFPGKNKWIADLVLLTLFRRNSDNAAEIHQGIAFKTSVIK